MGQATQVIKHSLARALSVICVFLVIAGLGYAVYFAFIKPNTKPNPTQATTQRASAITNTYVNPSTAEIVEAVKATKESAFELSLVPPRIKIGGFKIQIFGGK